MISHDEADFSNTETSREWLCWFNGCDGVADSVSTPSTGAGTSDRRPVPTAENMISHDGFESRSELFSKIIFHVCITSGRSPAWGEIQPVR